MEVTVERAISQRNLRSAWLGLLMSGLAGCFEAPNLANRLCDPSGACPDDYLCGADLRCHPADAFEAGTSADEPDAGAVEGTSPDAGGPAADGGGFPMTACSMPGGATTRIEIVNHCTTPVTVAWVGADCTEVVYSTLAPGAIYSGPSSANAIWRIRDSVSGKLLRQTPARAENTHLIACRELLHRYSFGDANDASGGGAATLFGGATIEDGQLVLDGLDDYASLPIGPTIASLESATIDVWMTWNDPERRAWARIFDFGQDTGAYAFLTTASSIGTTRFAVKNGGPEDFVEMPSVQPGVLTHLTVVVDARDRELRLYVNGEQVATKGMTRFSLHGIGDSANNWLGRSQYAADPYFKGSIQELRIYRDALSTEDIRASHRLGADTPLTFP